MTGRVILTSVLTAVVTSVLTVIVMQALGGDGNLLAAKVRVPSVAGLRPDQARLILETKELGLMTGEERHDSEVEAGLIVSQTPPEGTEVKRGGTLRVVVSKGADQLQVPALGGLNLTEAMKQLAAASLQVGAVTRQSHETLAPEVVISSIPEAGAALDRGSAVNLVVSVGKETVEVPALTNKWPKTAEQELKKAGLQLGKRSYGYDEDRRPGVIIRQEPAAGSQAPKGSAVDLVVNSLD